jgi:hypothetical protein
MRGNAHLVLLDFISIINDNFVPSRRPVGNLGLSSERLDFLLLLVLFLLNLLQLFEPVRFFQNHHIFIK